MIDLEFLEKYPLATVIIKDWFHQLMVKSFRDPEIAEEFKEFVQEQGMELDKLAFLINSNPRMLFDVFDENDIIIVIGHHENFGFNYAVCEDNDQQQYFKNRKEAEHASIKVAFEILEDQLTPDVTEIDVAGEEIVKE